MTDDELWADLEEKGRLDGHMVAQCPACGQRQMVRWWTPSQQPPRCKVCTPGSLTAGKRVWDPELNELVKLEAPILERTSPPPLRKHPGKPRSQRELRQDYAAYLRWLANHDS